MTNFCLLTGLASTLFMTGLVWFVHVVHYPLFDRVGQETFRRYHAEHTRATGLVVAIPMILELASAAFLVYRPPADSESWLAGLGLACAAISWITTFVFSVPCHQALAKGFDIESHHLLVRTNGIRVASWTAHSLVMLTMTARAIR